MRERQTEIERDRERGRGEEREKEGREREKEANRNFKEEITLPQKPCARHRLNVYTTQVGFLTEAFSLPLVPTSCCSDGLGIGHLSP